MKPDNTFSSENTTADGNDSAEELVQLTFEETRVLGSLIEKELTTLVLSNELNGLSMPVIRKIIGY